MSAAPPQCNSGWVKSVTVSAASRWRHTNRRELTNPLRRGIQIPRRYCSTAATHQYCRIEQRLALRAHIPKMSVRIRLLQPKEYERAIVRP